MADGLIDFTGKPLPAGHVVGDTGAPSGLIDFTGKSLPKGHTVGGYDPAQAEAIEPGVTKGLQPSMIQPADLLTFGLAGGAEAAGRTALEQGTGLLGREALGAGLKTAARTVPAIGVSAATQAAASPLTSALSQSGPVGQLAGGVTEQLAGMAPFMTGGEAPNTGLMARFKGATPVKEEALAATEKAQSGNIAAQEKLATKSAAERAAEKQSIATAAEKTGQAGLKERAEVAESAADKARKAALGQRADMHAAVMGARDRYGDVKQQADKDLAERTQALKQSAAQELKPEATQAAIGVTPPPSTMPQGPERIARDEEFRQTIKAPLQQWRSQWGSRRDQLLAPYMNAEPPLEPLHQGIAEELSKWPPGRAPYSPRVHALLNSTAKLGLGDEAQIPDQEVNGRNLRDLAKVDPEAARKLAEQIGLLEPPKPPTVKDLLTRQAEANRLAVASKGADRTAAERVSGAIDDALSSVAPTPELKALNAEYRDHRTQFPHEFESSISGAARPVDIAPKIFNEPQRALDLAHLGDASTKQGLRTLYAQWVDEAGDKVIDPAHAPFLKEIAAGTPYADPKGWVYEKKAENHFNDVINSSPQVKAKWEAAVKQGEQEFFNDYSRKIAAFAFKDAPKYGPLGQRLITQMRAVNRPENQATIAGKFYAQLTPEQAVSALEPTLPSAERAAGGAITEQRAMAKTPQRAAYEAQTSAPRTARQAESGFVPKDPSEAGIQAVQEYGYHQTSMAGIMKRRMLWTIPGAFGGAMLTGHPSGYALGALAIDAPIMGRELIARSFQNSLKDPVKARAFYNAITNPGTPKNFQFLAGEAAKAGVASAAERAGYDMSIPVPHSEEGPGMKSLNTSRAEHLAPTPSASKRAEKVTEHLSKGKNPEIHNDLNRGRLSLDEVNKLVQFNSSDKLSSSIQGMPLSELLDALEVANPEEVKLLVPLVKQRLMAELPQEKNMTLASNLSKRFQSIQGKANQPQQQEQA